MRKIVVAFIAVLLASGLGACGGSDKKKTPPTASTAQPTTTSSTPGVSTEQKAETTVAAQCLDRFSKKIKGTQQYAKPAILGYLKSGNVVALVMYGPKGGARTGEKQIIKEHPKFDAYHSPNDKILIFYGRKPSSGDFKIGDTCQKAAGAAGSAQ